MNFKDIILPKTVIAEIYKNHLVEIEKRTKQAIKATDKNIEVTLSAIPFLGKNLQNILILVNYPNETYLPEGQFEFLERILKACDLDIDDIAILNTAKQTTSLEDWIKVCNPNAVLIFGVNTIVNQINSKKDFFIPATIGVVKMIKAPGLEEFTQDNNESKQLKSKLWLSLKQFFNLKK